MDVHCAPFSSSKRLYRYRCNCFCVFSSFFASCLRWCVYPRGVWLILYGYFIIWFARFIFGCHVLFSMLNVAFSIPVHFNIVVQVEDVLCIQINACLLQLLFFCFRNEGEKSSLHICFVLKSCKGYINYGAENAILLFMVLAIQSSWADYSWISRVREYCPFFFCSVVRCISSFFSSLTFLSIFSLSLPCTMSFSLSAFVPPSFNLFCYCDNFFFFFLTLFFPLFWSIFFSFFSFRFAVAGWF